MNWKLILQLSMFGLAMGLGAVFFLPSMSTIFLWLLVVVLSGYAIAKRCVRLRFLNGLLVGLFDQLLDTGVHVAFFQAYVVRHAQEMAIIHQFAPGVSLERRMVETSPVWALLYGVLIGLVALLIGAFVKTARPPAAEKA